MDSTAFSSAYISPLSRQQRTYVALYSLAENNYDRQEILRLNQVTEADLREFEESWLMLQSRPPIPDYLMPRLPKPE